MASENLIAVQSRVEREVGRVSLAGQLVAESRFELERVLRQWKEAGVARVVISMRDVDYIDSAGLSTLIAAHHRARLSGGDVVLCEFNPRLRSIFEIASIPHYVKVFSTEREAMTHLTRLAAELKKKGKGAKGRGGAKAATPSAKRRAPAKSAAKR